MNENDLKSAYWMELLVEGGVLPEKRLMELMAEANELTAIAVAFIKTAKSRKS